MYMDRIALTKILMQLFDVQRERKKQLIEKIRRLEALRQENQDVNNFWFQQYESLLRSKSNEMVKFLEALNPTLVQELFINGAFQHLPLLKDYVSDVRKLERLDKITLRKVDLSDKFYTNYIFSNELEYEINHFKL